MGLFICFFNLFCFILPLYFYLFFSFFILFRFIFVFCCIFYCFFVFDSMSDFSFAILCFEREIFDLFGLFFVGNDILSRVLSDWCCFFFALCKDFPLFGFFLFYFDLFGFDCRIFINFFLFILILFFLF